MAKIQRSLDTYEQNVARLRVFINQIFEEFMSNPPKSLDKYSKEMKSLFLKFEPHTSIREFFPFNEKNRVVYGHSLFIDKRSPVQAILKIFNKKKVEFNLTQRQYIILQDPLIPKKHNHSEEFVKEFTVSFYEKLLEKLNNNHNVRNEEFTFVTTLFQNNPDFTTAFINLTLKDTPLDLSFTTAFLEAQSDNEADKIKSQLSSSDYDLFISKILDNKEAITRKSPSHLLNAGILNLYLQDIAFSPNKSERFENEVKKIVSTLVSDPALTMSLINQSHSGLKWLTDAEKLAKHFNIEIKKPQELSSLLDIHTTLSVDKDNNPTRVYEFSIHPLIAEILNDPMFPFHYANELSSTIFSVLRHTHKNVENISLYNPDRNSQPVTKYDLFGKPNVIHKKLYGNFKITHSGEDISSSLKEVILDIANIIRDVYRPELHKVDKKNLPYEPLNRDFLHGRVLDNIVTRMDSDLYNYNSNNSEYKPHFPRLIDLLNKHSNKTNEITNEITNISRKKPSM